MDFDDVTHNVVCHFAVASVIIAGFVVSRAVAQQYNNWRARAGFLAAWLSVIAVAALFWGASAGRGGSLSTGVEAALTLGIACGLGIFQAWRSHST